MDRFTFTAAQFFGSTSSGLAVAGARGIDLVSARLEERSWCAVAIDPASDFDHAVAHFGDADRGWHLIEAGQILRFPGPPISRVGFRPVEPCTHAVGLCTLPAASTTPAPALCRQTLRILAWEDPAEVPAELPRSRHLAVEQDRLAIGADAGAGVYTLLTIHAPGLARIVAWASNDNNAAPGGHTIRLYSLRPAVGRTAAVEQTPRLSRLIGNTTLSGTADARARVEIVETDPGDREFAIAIVASADTATITCGFEGVRR